MCLFRPDFRVNRFGQWGHLKGLFGSKSPRRIIVPVLSLNTFPSDLATLFKPCVNTLTLCAFPLTFFTVFTCTSWVATLPLGAFCSALILFVPRVIISSPCVFLLAFFRLFTSCVITLSLLTFFFVFTFFSTPVVLFNSVTSWSLVPVSAPAWGFLSSSSELLVSISKHPLQTLIPSCAIKSSEHATGATQMSQTGGTWSSLRLFWTACSKFALSIISSSVSLKLSKLSVCRTFWQFFNLQEALVCDFWTGWFSSIISSSMSLVSSSRFSFLSIFSILISWKTNLFPPRREACFCFSDSLINSIPPCPGQYHFDIMWNNFHLYQIFLVFIAAHILFTFGFIFSQSPSSHPLHVVPFFFLLDTSL